MTVVRAAFPRRLAVVLVLILLVQGVLIAVMVFGGDGIRPRQVPIKVVASSSLVAEAFADRISAVEDHPFETSISDDPKAARQDVRDGTTVVALLVDPSGTEDTLVVNEATDPQLVDAVVDSADVISRAGGRTFVIERTHADGALLDSTDATYTAILLAFMLAFGLVVAISLVRGPIARTFSLGVLRIVGIAGTAVVVGGRPDGCHRAPLRARPTAGGRGRRARVPGGRHPHRCVRRPRRVGRAGDRCRCLRGHRHSTADPDPPGPAASAVGCHGAVDAQRREPERPLGGHGVRRARR